MKRFALAIGAVLLAQTVLAQGLPQGAPESVGLSTGRLEQVMGILDGEVKAGRIGGAVFGIERHGKLVWLKAVGFRDKAANLSMTTDTIFPLASMTKPIVSVAAMALVEQGRIGLRDPVSKHLPAFKDIRVVTTAQGGAAASEAIATEPAARQVTIQDLFRHTSGLVNGRLFSRTPLKQAYVETGVYETQTLGEMVDKISRLPLGYQPGTQWDYGESVDVLARIVEVVSGVPLDQFVASTITAPLKMTDTSYNVPETKWTRVAQPIALPNGSLPRTQDTRRGTTLFRGSSGLVGTAVDYLRFTQMLLNRGDLEGTRILGGGMVDHMRADALGPIARETESGKYLLGPGYGFGLGFAVRIADGESAFPGTKGAYGWSGAYGTQFLVDPQRDMAAVLMINQVNQYPRIFELFNTLVYQTLAE